MDLKINDQIFIVGGATSGFGRAIAEHLIYEGAKVIGIARGADKIAEMVSDHPDQFVGIAGDITDSAIIKSIDEIVNVCNLAGIVLNAGGPPATTALETTMDQWDESYKQVLRWKINLVQHYLPHMIKAGYGRLLFIESYSVKQAVDNLVLSNSLRMAVVGYVKTIAKELATSGLTFNVLAPGFHSTPAAQRLVKKRSDQLGISLMKAEEIITSEIPMSKMGDPADFGSLAAWLLSPHSRYITGQTISVDGGAVLGSFG